MYASLPRAQIPDRLSIVESACSGAMHPAFAAPGTQVDIPRNTRWTRQPCDRSAGCAPGIQGFFVDKIASAEAD